LFCVFSALSEGFFAWVWGFAIARFLVCGLGCFFGLGFVFSSVCSLCKRFFLHKHVDLAGFECDACWRELVEESPSTIYRFDGIVLAECLAVVLDADFVLIKEFKLLIY
jgi:hypothetical protein